MSTTANLAGSEFVLTRRLDAPRERVWRAWTDTEHLRHWWGPKGFRMLDCRMDLRPGGLFLYGMQTPNGQAMWGRWLLREIDAPERLVFVVSFSDEQGGITRNPWAPDWPLEMLSTLRLSEQAGGTLLTLASTPVNATEAEHAVFKAGHGSLQQGWTGTLEQLDAHLKEARP